MGQFGSLSDSITNKNNDHTGWAVVNLRMSDNLATYAQASVTEASASFSGLRLDPAQVSATPPGFDYVAVSDLGKYSRLRVRWWYTEFGLRQSIRGRFLFDYALTYQDYRDSQPYLVDATGKNWGFLLRMNYLF
ncbi:MAG: hypothetical protein HXY20_10775 [Acidobacteria bacterium]|nr:hypothetical protein [Acidobacteriota bacterium]